MVIPAPSTGPTLWPGRPALCLSEMISVAIHHLKSNLLLIADIPKNLTHLCSPFDLTVNKNKTLESSLNKTLLLIITVHQGLQIFGDFSQRWRCKKYRLILWYKIIGIKTYAYFKSIRTLQNGKWETQHYEWLESFSIKKAGGPSRNDT